MLGALLAGLAALSPTFGESGTPGMLYCLAPIPNTGTVRQIVQVPDGLLLASSTGTLLYANGSATALPEDGGSGSGFNSLPNPEGPNATETLALRAVPEGVLVVKRSGIGIYADGRVSSVYQFPSDQNQTFFNSWVEPEGVFISTFQSTYLYTAGHVVKVSDGLTIDVSRASDGVLLTGFGSVRRYLRGVVSAVAGSEILRSSYVRTILEEKNEVLFGTSAGLFVYSSGVIKPVPGFTGGVYWIAKAVGGELIGTDSGLLLYSGGHVSSVGGKISNATAYVNTPRGMLILSSDGLFLYAGGSVKPLLPGQRFVTGQAYGQGALLASSDALFLYSNGAVRQLAQGSDTGYRRFFSTTRGLLFGGAQDQFLYYRGQPHLIVGADGNIDNVYEIRRGEVLVATRKDLSLLLIRPRLGKNDLKLVNRDVFVGAHPSAPAVTFVWSWTNACGAVAPSYDLSVSFKGPDGKQTDIPAKNFQHTADGYTFETSIPITTAGEWNFSLVSHASGQPVVLAIAPSVQFEPEVPNWFSKFGRYGGTIGALLAILWLLYRRYDDASLRRTRRPLPMPFDLVDELLLKAPATLPYVLLGVSIALSAGEFALSYLGYEGAASVEPLIFNALIAVAVAFYASADAMIKQQGAVARARALDESLRASIEQIKSSPVDLEDAQAQAKLRARVEFESNLRNPLRIRRVEVTGIDIFADLEWELQPGVNVLLGRNGYGKTHLLQALVAALVKDDERSAALVTGPNDSVLIEFERLTATGEDGTAEFTERRARSFVRSVGKVPVLAIPDSRALNKSRRVIDIPAQDGPDLREGGAYNFLYQLPYEPIIQTFLYELCIEASTAKNFDSPIFTLTRNIVEQLSGQQFKFSQVRSLGQAKFALDVITEGNDQQPIPIQSASQGTQSILAMFGVIYQYLQALDPALPERDLLNQRGIVLIDEVDAHLHPFWQRKIVPLLRSTFPRVQFILTAHSPLVVAGCLDGEVAVLKRGKENRFTILQFQQDFIGWDSEQIYRTVFGIEEPDESFKTYSALAPSRGTIEQRLSRLKTIPDPGGTNAQEIRDLEDKLYYIDKVGHAEKDRSDARAKALREQEEKMANLRRASRQSESGGSGDSA